MTEYNLETLNAARIAKGKKPLKAWKASKLALAQAIIDETMVANIVADPMAAFEATPDELAAQALRPTHLDDIVPTFEEMHPGEKNPAHDEPDALLIDDKGEVIRESELSDEEHAKAFAYVEPIKGYKKPSTRMKAEMHADKRPTKEIMKEVAPAVKRRQNSAKAGAASAKAKKETIVNKEVMKRAAKTTYAGDPIALADLARELKLDPKLARVKARRHLREYQIASDAWTFLASDKDAIVAILNNDQRKK